MSDDAADVELDGVPEVRAAAAPTSDPVPSIEGPRWLRR
jgi:hypothetical protein